MFSYDSPSNLDDSELIRRDGAEMRQVLLDFPLGADIGKELNDGGARR